MLEWFRRQNVIVHYIVTFILTVPLAFGSAFASMYITSVISPPSGYIKLPNYDLITALWSVIYFPLCLPILWLLKRGKKGLLFILLSPTTLYICYMLVFWLIIP